MATMEINGCTRYVSDSHIRYFEFFFPEKYKGKWAVYCKIDCCYEYIGSGYKFCKKKAEELNASLSRETREWAYKRLLENDD